MMWILLASYPNLMHVNQTMHELLTNMELGPKDLRKIIYIQRFTEAQGTDGPKISLAKLLGASATDWPQKHWQICAGSAGCCDAWACGLSTIVQSTHLAVNGWSGRQRHSGDGGACCQSCLCVGFTRLSIINARCEESANSLQSWSRTSALVLPWLDLARLDSTLISSSGTPETERSKKMKLT